jgi:serine/threonine protein kinase
MVNVQLNTSRQVDMALKGAVLGNYMIEEPLGVGTFFQVYRSRHTNFSDESPHYVATRILKQNLVAKDHFSKEFQEEIKKWWDLKHKNIVQILDAGKIKDTHHAYDGYAYVHLEYVPSTLYSIVDSTRNGLPEDKLLQVAKNTLEGLVFLHSKEITHGDIHQNNIMIQKDQKGDAGENEPELIAKLTDFGMAKQRKQYDIIKKTGSLSNHFLENTSGKKAVDDKEFEESRREDIEDLGKTLYFAATKLRADLNFPTIEKINKAISRDLIGIINKTYEYDHRNRFQSAQEMLEALMPMYNNFLYRTHSPRFFAEYNKILKTPSILTVNNINELLEIREEAVRLLEDSRLCKELDQLYLRRYNKDEGIILSRAQRTLRRRYDPEGEGVFRTLKTIASKHAEYQSKMR